MVAESVYEANGGSWKLAGSVSRVARYGVPDDELYDDESLKDSGLIQAKEVCGVVLCQVDTELGASRSL